MESLFDILLIPMGFILRIAYTITDNYLLAIMLFTLVMEILLLPLGIKQQKNQVKQATFAPKVAAIKKKYAGRNDQATQQKMQNEIMEMYREENFNPAGGCGTLIIQLPIILALFNVVTNPLRYICNMPTAEITALTTALGDKVPATSHYPQYNLINYLHTTDISQYYNHAPSLENIMLPDFTIGSIDLSQNPSFKPLNWLVIIPILTFVVMIASQYIMKKFTYQSPENEAAQNNMSMKIMTWTMPLLSVYFEFQMPAVIGVYWVFRNILSTLQRILLAKLIPTPKYTEEDFKEAERQANMSNKQKKREMKENGEKKFVRSLHYIDDEEYLARHAEDLKGEVTNVPSAKKETKLGPAPMKDEGKNHPEDKGNTENSEK
ncbi:MAG: YidC/Oxa1 family membrane protein insertase [Ruminococcaceae bacterium]|nr:YidC/Oxa1 family membrane protein insertase [Oscillospiraceae bacterium]